MQVYKENACTTDDHFFKVKNAPHEKDLQNNSASS